MRASLHAHRIRRPARHHQLQPRRSPLHRSNLGHHLVEQQQLIVGLTNQPRRRANVKSAAAASTQLSSSDDSPDETANDNTTSDMENLDLKFVPQMRAIVAFCVPSLATYATGPLLGATDAFFVGRFAEDGVRSLAALSPATALADSVWLVFCFLSVAATNAMARCAASSDDEDSIRTLSDATFLAVTIGVVLAGILAFAALPTLQALSGTDVRVAHLANAYIIARAGAMPVQMLTMVLTGASVGYFRDSVTPFRAALVASIANAALDLFFVAGLRLGVFGAGLATSISQAVQGILLARALQQRRIGGKPFLQFRRQPSGKALKLLQFSVPFFLMKLLTTFKVLIWTQTGAAFGTLALASHQVAMSVWKLLILTGEPLSLCAQSFLPSRLAHPEQRRIFLTALFTLALATTVLVAVSSVVLLPIAAGQLTTDAAVRSIIPTIALPLAISSSSFPLLLAAEGCLLAMGRVRLLCLAMAWNVVFFYKGTRAVLANDSSWASAWMVFSAMHAIYTVIMVTALVVVPAPAKPPPPAEQSYDE